MICNKQCIEDFYFKENITVSMFLITTIAVREKCKNFSKTEKHIILR